MKAKAAFVCIATHEIRVHIFAHVMKWSDLEQWIMVLMAIRNTFTIVIQVNVCQKKLKSVFRHVTPKKWC